MAGIVATGAAVLVGLGAGLWLLTIPERIPQAEIAALAPGDAFRGERIFYASGCSSCHAAAGAAAAGLPQLPGGARFETDFGTYIAPNISQHPTDGIGGWSLADFANAVQKGVAPDGSHYYPSFPYTSYARMKLSDVADLYVFMKALPSVAGKAPEHEIGFPFNIRPGIGLWKWLYLSPEPVLTIAGASDQVRAGQYLVEGPAHCGECHTRRNLIGALVKEDWLAGAVAAQGEGIVPNITPEGRDVGHWSDAEIAEYLSTGFTPDYDSAGGAMAEVIKNTARLHEEDRAAIAAYLKAIPGRPNGYPARD